MGALSITDVEIFRSAYAPLLRLSATVPSPDKRQALPGESAADVARRAAAKLEVWLQQHHAHTAALVVEPLLQCAAGMVMYDPLYLRLAREMCTRYQVHLVVDEIATGFGRTGSMFAHQQAGIRPDFICLSKGLTGGTLPLSAVLTTEDVYQAFMEQTLLARFCTHIRTQAILWRAAQHWPPWSFLKTQCTERKPRAGKATECSIPSPHYPSTGATCTPFGDGVGLGHRYHFAKFCPVLSRCRKGSWAVATSYWQHLVLHAALCVASQRGATPV